MLREQSGDEAGIRLPAWIVPDFTDLGQYTHTSTSEVTAGKRSRWAGQSGPHKSTGTVSEAAHRLCCSCSPSERNVVVGTVTTCVEMERLWGGRLWKIKDENKCADRSLSLPLSVCLPGARMAKKPRYRWWENTEGKDERPWSEAGHLEVSRRPDKPGVFRKDKKLGPWSLEQI